MKISMDKKYRTRDGRDVRLLCVDGPKEDMPVFGFISGNLGTSVWRVDGSWSATQHANDLIEYHEPDIRTIWVNVYEEGGVMGYNTERSARYAAFRSRYDPTLIALPVKIEVPK